MDEGIYMSKREQLVVKIIEDFRAGRISRKEAAEILGMSEKTVQRKAKKVRERGLAGVKHGNCGRMPSNKKSAGFKEALVELVRAKYFDFNLAHAREMIEQHHHIKVSYGSFYTWCVQSGLGKGRKRRRISKARIMRERMANEGLMLQMDGSHHAWNGSDKWCLIAMIDDATSHIPYGEFFPSETTFACMKVLRKVIEIKGIPEIIYTDEAGWADNSKRQFFSQFNRACQELGIRLVTTSQPESKGRIERAWRTIQDRIVPEFRLLGVKSMEDGNRYLQQTFLPAYWNERNTVEPRHNVTRYRSLPPHLCLDQIFCYKYDRQINRDHTIHFEGTTYKVLNREFGSLRGKQISVHADLATKKISIYWGHIELSIEKVVPPFRRWVRKTA